MDTREVIGEQHGATLVSENQTRFHVWAPRAKTVHVELIRQTGDQLNVISKNPLDRDRRGYFSGLVENCPVGTYYRYSLNHHFGRPDPYSRFQPLGVHGPSQVIDPHAYHWKDQSWGGVEKRDLIVYELHIGSFTSEGTYLAAIEQLDELVQLGITAIELLPVMQTPGRWNWGYDGVNFFAPRNTYGTPDELKALVDACHARGLAILLDVVYNHVGPEGNYLNEFGPYRSLRHATPWGDSLNFDGPRAKPVREFVISNVLYWMQEYHFDGLRLDAVHFMFDESDLSIAQEIRQRFREFEKSIERRVHLIAETNIFDPELLADANADPLNYDAIWSDCLMHSIYSQGDPGLRLSDRKYIGAADLAEALEHAYVFSAPQAFRMQPEDRQRHHPAGDRKYIQSLIMALQTHDSVGNHPQGKRLGQLTSFHFQKSAAALILLYPSIPMMFMGEESASESPFPFFVDFEDSNLRSAVDQGRRNEYPHHDWSDSPLPSDPIAFYSSKPNPAGQSSEMRSWYQQLLSLRKRGIREGWLDVKYMTARHDRMHDVFQLIYQTSEQRVVISARLAAPGAPRRIWKQACLVKVLLDSQSVNFESADVHDEAISLELADQHCCVWIEPS